jgi:hypothetical protein
MVNWNPWLAWQIQTSELNIADTRGFDWAV